MSAGASASAGAATGSTGSSAVAGVSAAVGACACARMHAVPPPSPQSARHAPLASPQPIAAITAPASAAPIWSGQVSTVCEKTGVEQASVKNMEHVHSKAHDGNRTDRVRILRSRNCRCRCALVDICSTCEHVCETLAVSECCVQDGLVHRMRMGSTVNGRHTTCWAPASAALITS